MAAKKKPAAKATPAKKPTSKAKSGKTRSSGMNEVDMAANAQRLKMLDQLNKQIDSMGYRGSTAPRVPGKPPSPSNQYRGLANVRDILSQNTIRGNKIKNTKDMYAAKPTAGGRVAGWGGGGRLGAFGSGAFNKFGRK